MSENKFLESLSGTLKFFGRPIVTVTRDSVCFPITLLLLVIEFSIRRLGNVLKILLALQEPVKIISEIKVFLHPFNKTWKLTIAFVT